MARLAPFKPTSPTRLSALIAVGALLAPGFHPSPASAQTATPPPAIAPAGLPPAVATATSIEGVIAVLGAGKPELSTHLLLDVPQIAAPGRITARARSSLPATGALILLRGAPAAAAIAGTPSVTPAAMPPRPATSAGPVLLAAMLVRSGQDASMNVRLDIDRTQALTLLTYAQGRWYITTREVKIAKPRNAASP